MPLAGGEFSGILTAPCCFVKDNVGAGLAPALHQNGTGPAHFQGNPPHTDQGRTGQGVGAYCNTPLQLARFNVISK
ncbi:MAG: hypothetical protein A3E19_03560 [Planctomycetes bacterium RIFCSPHIGHO2_12_FULL_52_36]|nr:MAG: hypothetical protein A3E19_03560 [Planctomycetes bacterium RIFCSPHIGHO2_12_FULL_52_36]